jgi:hypothetical protein
MPRRSGNFVPRSERSLVEPSLVDKVIELHHALVEAEIAHGFGGALALAYYTHEPRATADIDVNIALEAQSATHALSQLPSAIKWTPADVARIHIDDQVRLWWGRTPIDLFFRASPFHDGVQFRMVRHSFAGREIPFLAASDLGIFKSLFNRPKDWLDIEAMVAADSIDPLEVAETLTELLGEDARVDRMRALVQR